MRERPAESFSGQAAFLALLLAVLLGLPAAQAESVQTGAAVADFELERLGGGTLSLSGREESSSLVLVFFRGVW